MELLKQHFNMSQQKSESNLQITLDDDFNVPDIKPDIDKIVKEQGNIVVQEVTPMNDRFTIKGNLEFHLLYGSQESNRPIHSMTGQIPFEEMVNMDGITPDEAILVRWELEDMNVSLINSRKINVKAIISLHFTAESSLEESIAVSVENGDGIEYRKEQLNLTQTVLSKKDTYRIKDEMTLPIGKDNIEEVLYTKTELLEKETKNYDNKINLKGILRIFCLYIGENENRGIQFYETELPISTTIDCEGCSDDMIADIEISIASQDIQVKPDSDGEERVLDLEVVLNLDIKLLREEEIEILKDLYSTKNMLDIKKKEAKLRNLVVKNNSKLRVVDTISVDETKPAILQICNSTGTVKIDETHMEDKGIQVDGVVCVQILYITNFDDRPVNAIRGDIPFSQLIEVKELTENSTFEIKSYLDQLSMMMIDEKEIEVKATIGLEAIVFDSIAKEIILDAKELDSLDEIKKNLPSIVGYIVKDGDYLWDIAKQFYTTAKEIKEVNGLDADELEAGQKLIICK